MQLKAYLSQILQNLPYFLPEIWLSVFFVVSLIGEVVLRYSRWVSSTPTIIRIAAASMLTVILFLIWWQHSLPPGYLFDHLLYLDAKAVFFKIFIVIGALLVLLHVHLTRTVLPVEFYGVLLVTTLGLCLMTMATHGLSIYLSIELVSISSYLMAAWDDDRKSSEGGLKYLLFGALSAAVMLYGLSFLYGITGTLDITADSFAIGLMQNSPQVQWFIGILILAGVLFKLSMVPFHVWTPDVYEGASMPVVAYLSTVPKLAAILLLMRLLSALPEALSRWLLVLVLASILVGNLSALWQQNLKRLMAYSGIAQASFIGVGIVAFNQTGFEAATFYAVVYLFMNLGVFLCIDLLTDHQPTLESLAGRGTQEVTLSVCLTVLMIALVGLPPTAGFTAKLFVFSGLWEYYQTSSQPLTLALLLIGLLNAVISLFYYLKLPYYLFFKSASAEQKPLVKVEGRLAGLFFALVTLVLFFKADVLLGWIAKL